MASRDWLCSIACLSNRCRWHRRYAMLFRARTARVRDGPENRERNGGRLFLGRYRDRWARFQAPIRCSRSRSFMPGDSTGKGFMRRKTTPARIYRELAPISDDFEVEALTVNGLESRASDSRRRGACKGHAGPRYLGARCCGCCKAGFGCLTTQFSTGRGCIGILSSLQSVSVRSLTMFRHQDRDRHETSSADLAGRPFEAADTLTETRQRHTHTRARRCHRPGGDFRQTVRRLMMHHPEIERRKAYTEG